MSVLDGLPSRHSSLAWLRLTETRPPFPPTLFIILIHSATKLTIQTRALEIFQDLRAMATYFHPFGRLPVTLQSDILASALPQKPVLISAFWNRSTPTSRECSLFLPKNSSHRTLRNLAALNDPLSAFVPIYLTQTVTSSQTQPLTNFPGSPLPALKNRNVLSPPLNRHPLPTIPSLPTTRKNLPQHL